jgi:hypothetical protein
LRVSSDASARGVEASAKSRSDAAYVTSSLVRRLRMVEMRMRNGSRSRWAISVTEASFPSLRAERMARIVRSSTAVEGRAGFRVRSMR